MIDMHNFFNAKWVQEKILLPEGPFLDFKQEPPIYDKSGDKNFTFAKHLIAFGNIARSTGRECYIIFGVDDNSRQTIDLSKVYHPADVKEWDENTSVQSKQSDGIESRIAKIADKWIKPVSPSLSLIYGRIQDGTFLSYLVIHPTYTSIPFSLKESHKNHSVGTVFMRKCSSSVSVESSEIKYLLPSNEIAYLARSEWQKFFQAHSSGEFLKSQNLLPTFLHKTKDGRDALESVVNAVHLNKKIILIKGAAGIGKSTLLRRVAYKMSFSVNLEAEIDRGEMGEGSEKLDDETYTIRDFKNEVSNLPRSRVPVYMSLRRTFQSVDEINNLLLNEVQNILSKKFDKLDCFLKNENISWVILLDGVDEIRNRYMAGPILGLWLRLLPQNVQVVLTSRPHASPDLASEVLEIAPLHAEDILYLVNGKVEASLMSKSEKEIGEIKNTTKMTFEFLQSHPEFLEFLDRHRAIDGFLEYLGIPIEPISSNDIPYTLVEQKEIEVLSGDNIGHLPVIGSEDQLINEEDFPESKLDDLDEYESSTPHRLVQMLQVVYDHLKTAEVVRQREWGNESKTESEDAAYELARAAWYGNWQKNELNMENTEKTMMDKSTLKMFLEWNQFAGFISRAKLPRFKYCCNLFQQYLIAEYGYENRFEEMSAVVIEHGGATNNYVSSITSLYNEFCEWRGGEPISLQQ